MNRALILSTTIAAAIGLAGMLLILFAWHLPPFAPSLPTTENAYLKGKVTMIAPQLSGYVSTVPVQDFQQVKAGDVIATLDDRIYRQKLAQAEAALAGAEASLDIARQNLRSAEATERAAQATREAAQSAFSTAQLENDRSVSLRERGITSETVAQQAALALDQARAEFARAMASLDVQHELHATSQAQIASAEAQIANAAAAVELARIDLSNTIIHAPADGRLGQISAHPGQYVAAGSALASHVGTEIWIIANFNEGNLGDMKPGQPIGFTVDALPRQKFTGWVESLSPATASEFSLLSGSNATGNFTKIPQRVPVHIAITPDQNRLDELAPGMSVVVTAEAI